MGTITFLMLAVGLAMDAFAVSVSNSMCFKNYTKKQELATSAAFGLFQGMMPVIGYLAGRVFTDFISSVDHWVVLVLLGFIGGKMLLDAVKEMREPESCPAGVEFTTKTMLLQALATSIDALAVGISFAALNANIFVMSSGIAVITFLCCFVGCLLGRRFGSLLGSRAQLVGGLILIGIGIKIFVEHMWLG